MADIQLTPKDILDKEFKKSFRGFDMEEVDAFLDIIMKDYATFKNQVNYLESENARLKAKIDELSQQSQSRPNPITATGPTPAVTNFDILKRLSNLEKRVFDDRLQD
ncbi:cell division regulator GpsB [Atopobacter sp. AH10]|uniref:cell division regulator GpsB n=1 Tax=Atopobacter sp. AH10 TaxID=2315861 RepID=UPI000EF1E27F|nr:cell division regulator GpsB [Atopobacter sp. AH10]RLK62474.1 cell division regulator GpsB [Atopobacter sp. AH10]